jgi:hypothetical protein
LSKEADKRLTEIFEVLADVVPYIPAEYPPGDLPDLSPTTTANPWDISGWSMSLEKPSKRDSEIRETGWGGHEKRARLPSRTDPDDDVVDVTSFPALDVVEQTKNERG